MNRNIFPLLSLLLVVGLFSAPAAADEWTSTDSYCKDLDPSKKKEFTENFRMKTGMEKANAPPFKLPQTFDENFLKGVCKVALWNAVADKNVRTYDANKKKPIEEGRKQFDEFKTLDEQIETVRQYALDYKKVHEQLEEVQNRVDVYRTHVKEFTESGGLETEEDVQNLKALIPKLIEATGDEKPVIRNEQPRAPRYGTLLFDWGQGPGNLDFAFQKIVEIDRVNGQFKKPEWEKWHKKTWKKRPLREKYQKIYNKLRFLDKALAERLKKAMVRTNKELWTVNQTLKKAVAEQREALNLKNKNLKANGKDEIEKTDLDLFNEQLDQLYNIRKNFRADLLDEIGRRNYELLKRSDKEGGTQEQRDHVKKYATYAKFKAAHAAANDIIANDWLETGGTKNGKAHLKFRGHEILYTKRGKTTKVLLPNNFTGRDYDLAIKKIADMIIEDRNPKQI